MMYVFYSAFCFIAGIAVSAYFLRRTIDRGHLAAWEFFILGGGIGYIAMHGLLLGLMLFLPFQAAFSLTVIAGGMGFLYATRQLFLAGYFLRLRDWLGENLLSKKFLSNWRGWIACAIICVVAGSYANAYLNTLVEKQGTLMVATAGYGDVPYHLNQISYFSNGPRLHLDDPTYAGMPLKYPFLINFMSATLLRLGAPMPVAFHVPGFFFGVGGILLLFALLRRLARGKGLFAIGGVLLVLFSANTRFFRLWGDGFFSAAHSFREVAMYLANLPFKVAVQWDAVWPEQNVASMAFVTNFMLHQRASIMGIWAVLAILILWQLAVQETDETRDRTEYMPLGLLLALLPLLHTHGFVALTIAGLWWVVRGIIVNDQRVITVVRALAWTLPFVLWEMAYLLMPHPDLTFAPHVRLGWMSDPSGFGGLRVDPAGMEPHWQTWLRFMWVNFGIYLPASLAVLAAGYAWLWRSLAKPIVHFFLAGSILLFAFANIVQLQAWDFDTNKILGYFSIFSTAFLVAVFAALHDSWEASPVRRRILGAVFFLLVLFSVPTGALDLYSRLTFVGPATPNIFEPDAVRAGEWVRANVPADAVFVSSDNHLNPVNSLGGMRVVLGFKGWLWSHGVTYAARDNMVRAFIDDPMQVKGSFGVFGPAFVLLDPKWRNEEPELEGKLRAALGFPLFDEGRFAIWKL